MRGRGIMKYKRVIVVGVGFVAGALGMGCGGEGSGSGVGDDPCAEGRSSAACLQALDEGCAERHAAACAAYFQCSPNLAPIYYGTVETCTQQYTEQCKNRVRLSGVLITPADMHACAQSYIDEPCTDALREACTIPGEREIGELCGQHAECKSDFCAATMAEADCGICQSMRAKGQSCNVADGDCFWGLTCLTTTHTCDLRLVEGAACTDHNDCEGNLLCIGEKCSKALAQGTPCTDELCDWTQLLSCIGGKCDKFAVVGVGESCTVDWCAYGAFCNDKSVCEAEPIEGQACTASCAGVSFCINGLCSLGYAVCE